MEMKERIQKIIEIKCKSVLAFEKQIGLSNGYIRNTKSISADVCSRILAAFPDISPDWLLNGNGEMLRQLTPEEERISKLMDTIETLQDMLAKQNKMMAELTEMLKQHNSK